MSFVNNFKKAQHVVLSLSTFINPQTEVDIISALGLSDAVISPLPFRR